MIQERLVNEPLANLPYNDGTKDNSIYLRNMATIKYD